MMVLLDTNIILDALQERQPFDVAAKELLLRSQKGEIKCCFTANTVTDIFYIYSKARDVNSARNALSFLLANYTVISVTHQDCNYALSLSINDFEDALVVACAEQAGVDYIVTRDEVFLRSDSSISVVSPSKLLEKLL